jgi:Reverse transcriptase (RNA-dependent DNA polymerase)
VSQYEHDQSGPSGLTTQLQTLGSTNILFPSECGGPQGDVANPFGWNAVYDILLRALTIQHHHIPDTSTQAIAYADDLLSISSTLASLQHQDDLVAAFTDIFKLDLAHTKFQAYEFPYHRTHTKSHKHPL